MLVVLSVLLLVKQLDWWLDSRLERRLVPQSDSKKVNWWVYLLVSGSVQSMASEMVTRWKETKWVLLTVK